MAYDLGKYNTIRKVRDSFKRITQLSYNINQIDRRFPIDALDENSYNQILQVYRDFAGELEKGHNDVKEVFEKLDGQK